MTPSKRILAFIRENFANGIDTFASHKWLSVSALQITDINGGTAIVSYNADTDEVVLD